MLLSVDTKIEGEWKLCSSGRIISSQSVVNFNLQVNPIQFVFAGWVLINKCNLQTNLNFVNILSPCVYFHSYRVGMIVRKTCDFFTAITADINIKLLQKTIDDTIILVSSFLINFGTFNLFLLCALVCVLLFSKSLLDELNLWEIWIFLRYYVVGEKGQIHH